MVRAPHASRAASILIVEDDPVARSLLTTTLTLAGYLTTEAADADQAVAALARGRFALIVLDNRLPGMSGVELLRMLRRLPATRTVPVILLTSDGDIHERVTGLRAGATDYITKPYEPAELVARLEAHLRTNDAWGAVMDAQLRQRGSLVQAINAITSVGAGDPSDTGGRDLAVTACELLAGLEHLDGAAVIRVEPGVDAKPLAIRGSRGWGEQVRALCSSPASFFAMRGEGAWIGAEDTKGSGTIAFAPLCAGDRVVGILLLGAARTPSDSNARVGERLLAEAIDYAMVLTGVLGVEFGLRRDRSQVHDDITALIATRAFAPVFQPLIDLRDDTVVGFEALTRFSDGTAPEHRFAEAHLVGDGADLELAAMTAALEASSALPGDGFVSVNVSPSVIIDRTEQLTIVLQDAPRPTVLELTEHHRVDDYVALRDALDHLDPAVRVSVDDAGAGYASLRHVLRLAPDFVKLDRSWVTGIDDDTTRQALVAGLSHFADETGCDLVAEGIESISERDTLARLGVAIGQGYLLGVPEAPT